MSIRGLEEHGQILGAPAGLPNSVKQRFDGAAVAVASKAILEKLPSFIRAFIVREYVILLGLAAGLGVNISPAEASKRLTAIWDPSEGWGVMSNSSKHGMHYLKGSGGDTTKIDYNSTDSATLATEQKGYATLVWYMENKKPMKFVPPPSKWSQKATLEWINSSIGRTLIEKLKVIGDSHHTKYPDIYDSIGSYFPDHTIR